MIKRTLSLFSLTLTLAACGGGKYEHSEIPAVSPGYALADADTQPSPSAAVLAADVSPSNSKPVIYDYPGGTRQFDAPPVTSSGAVSATPAVPALPVTTSPSAAAHSGRTYTVQRGDTLWRIASNHGVSVSDLKRVNNLADDIIKVGQVLRIP